MNGEPDGHHDRIPAQHAGSGSCRQETLRRHAEGAGARAVVVHRPGARDPAASFLVAWGAHGSTASTYRIDGQWSAFTGLFILALAIERALEPFSGKLGPDKARRTSRSKVEMCRRLTAVVTWGVATGLGFLLCAALNITQLQAVRANGSGQPPFWADLLVTGLVVGAGTKPLHDLVCSIERSKQARQNPPPGSGLGR